jgi:nicotinate-nucleotide adenylyltransferase
LIKVAIFGGSFDPPHCGHYAISQSALDKLEIEKLIIVPTFLNPFKHSSLATPQMRLDWCKKVFNNKKIEVSSYEINFNRAIFSSQTVKYFKGLYDVKYLIIGADNLSSITRWHKFEWLDKNIIWVVASRDGFNLDTSMLKDSIILDISVKISSTDIRECSNLSYIDDKIVKEVDNIIQKGKV